MYVNVSCDDAFEVVAGIEVYPDFIDSCRAARLMAEHDNELHGELTMNFGGFEDSFPVRLRVDPAVSVNMQFRTGYLRRLEADWRFHASGPAGCEIELYAECDFGSRAKELLLGGAIDRTCLSLIEAVAAEAVRRGGARPRPTDGD